MTPEETIEILEEVKELDDTLYAYNAAYMEALEVALFALKEIQQYRKIGTVEECREAIEKQRPKKCIIDSCPDHAHYKCSSCGQIELSIYKHGFPRLGRITKYCENCGQALIDNSQKGMEDAVSND